MPSIIDQLGSLIASIYNTIVAAIGSIVAVFQSIFSAIFGVIRTIFAALGTAISGLAQTFEGLFKFLAGEFPQVKDWDTNKLMNLDAGNIIVIGALVAAFFLYTLYQQRTGGSAAPVKSKKIQ